jgi:hypothetical protein
VRQLGQAPFGHETHNLPVRVGASSDDDPVTGNGYHCYLADRSDMIPRGLIAVPEVELAEDVQG